MAAIGFVLLWQTSNTINFAQGEFVVLPAFAMVLFFVIFRLPFAAAMLATVLVSTLLLGWGVKQLLVTRLLRMGVLPLVIATIGLSLLIRYSLQQFWTPLALPFPAIFSRDPIRLGTIVVSLEEIGNIVFAAVVIGLGLKAFYAAIIGGFNQIRGALLGGLLVGVVETLSAAYISSHFRDAFALVILIAVLLLKPEGIWGVKEEWAS